MARAIGVHESTDGALAKLLPREVGVSGFSSQDADVIIQRLGAIGFRAEYTERPRVIPQYRSTVIQGCFVLLA